MHLTTHIIANGENAQDRLCVHRFADRVVMAVADGAGGRSGGAEAATLAIKIISQLASDLHTEEDCIAALQKAHAAIEKHESAGETTAVIAVVDGNEIFGASVGDSGAWLIADEDIHDLTADQNRKPFLGSGDIEPIGFSCSELEGALIIASDGLLKYASRDNIACTVRKSSFDTACQELVRLVRYPSGALPDDVAIAMCRLV